MSGAVPLLPHFVFVASTRASLLSVSFQRGKYGGRSRKCAAEIYLNVSLLPFRNRTWDTMTRTAVLDTPRVVFSAK
jgi:hypothetical protein